ncbi:hypothetical protein QQ045_008277 [Rhodiola kirilowii]
MGHGTKTRAYWMKRVHWWENNELINSSWVLRRLAMCKHLSSKCVDSVNGDLLWIWEGKGFTVKDTYHTLKAREAEVDWYSWPGIDLISPELRSMLS